ncbi:pPIWI_RE module domain-containing protein [Actinosynnema sp. CS-041913]|uniref:pPIWI_RE module domain-containing protein n=1 Tax=Actinosynnema sp. CS-041913 TaxID=3239917 RepID=UPI003D8FDFEB
MTVYDSLRVCAYEPDPDHGPWIEDLQVMTFAERWKSELMNLYALGWRSREPITGLPVRKLNSLLRAAAPGVIATGRGAASDPTVPWIYAHDRPPADLVHPLFLSWVMSLRPEPEHEAALARVLDSIGATTPLWTAEPVDLTATTVSRGGTGQPHRGLYGLLPELLATRLAARSYRPADVGADTAFRVVSTEQGAELVSWPPYQYTRARRPAHYSAVIKITLHTTAFVPNFRVHISYGIRRWATTTPVRIPDRRAATVLFDVPVPWDEEGMRTTRLIGNSTRFEPRLGRQVWRRHSVVDLLPDVDIIRTYPKPEDILFAPENWLRGQSGIAAGVVHSTAMGSHKIGTGLSPVEREQLDTWIADGLRPMFRRVPDSRRTSEVSKPSLLPKVSRDKPHERAAVERRAVEARRHALLAALGGEPLRIDIVWQLPETRTRLLDELAALLGLPDAQVAEEPVQEWEVGSLRVLIHTTQVHDLGSPLDVKGKDLRAVSEAVRARRVAVAARFDRLPGKPALALVEILGESRFGKANTDPKFALRLGFADVGRVSQFIQAQEDGAADLDARAKWIWLDGFRQLGAVPVPPGLSPGKPSVDVQYVALWVVRRKERGAVRRVRQHLVAVRIRPGDTTHPVCGWDDSRKAWVPYAELLIALSRDVDVASDDTGRWYTPEATYSEHRDDVQRRVRSILYQVRDRPTLLLANSANIRDSWPEMGNGALVKDMIAFSGEPAQRVVAYGNDLRIVLVRDRNSREEVPQWYAVDPDRGKTGFALGLWEQGRAEADNRVFASTADMPRNTPKVPRGLAKLGPNPNWPLGPTKSMWNPQYLELVVLGCLSAEALELAGRSDVAPDDPRTWAGIAHRLRFHDDYDPLARPLPMHLAKLAEEYILPREDSGAED